MKTHGGNLRWGAGTAWLMAHGLVVLLCFVFLPSLRAQTTEEAGENTTVSFEPRAYLKTDLMPIAEVIGFVFDHCLNKGYFIAPHVAVEAAHEVTGKSFSELLSNLEGKGKLRIRSIFDEHLYLAAPIERFNEIQTLAERNLLIVEKSGAFAADECVTYDKQLRSIPAGAAMAILGKKSRMLLKLDHVPEAELGVCGQVQAAQALSLAAAIARCDIYPTEAHELMVTPVDPSREPDKMPIWVPTGDSAEQIRVLATFGWSADSGTALLERGGEVFSVFKTTSIDGIWRVMQIRTGELDVVDERVSRSETWRVP